MEEVPEFYVVAFSFVSPRITYVRMYNCFVPFTFAIKGVPGTQGMKGEPGPKGEILSKF